MFERSTLTKDEYNYVIQSLPAELKLDLSNPSMIAFRCSGVFAAMHFRSGTGEYFQSGLSGTRSRRRRIGGDTALLQSRHCGDGKCDDPVRSV